MEWKEGEQAQAIWLLISGAAGGLANHLVVTAGIVATNNFEWPQFWINLIINVFVGAVIGLIFCTFLVGFEKPSATKLIAAALLCGILWNPLFECLPILLSKVSQTISMIELVNGTAQAASALKGQTKANGEDFAQPTSQAIQLMKTTQKTPTGLHTIKANGPLEPSDKTVERTVNDVLSAISEKYDDAPEAAALSIFKIGSAANQYGENKIARKAADYLRQFPNINQEAIRLLQDENPMLIIKPKP